MIIGILALQGAFKEHEIVLDKLGINYIELRNKENLMNKINGLILPGGESTVQGKLLKELDMFETIRQLIIDGTPVLATCAGLILLANEIDNETTTHLATLPVTVRRNAYGRQLGSFHTTDYVEGIGEVPMTFIRAPYIIKAVPQVNILSRVNGNIVGVEYKNQLAFSFHPELDDDYSIHRKFISMC